MGQGKSKTVVQCHHLIYENGNKEVTRQVRKGVHQICGLIRRYNYLTSEEANTIHIEVELKRRFL